MNFVLLRGPASDVCQGNHSCSSRLSVHFFSESLIVLSFTFRSVIHFDVTFSSVFFLFCLWISNSCTTGQRDYLSLWITLSPVSKINCSEPHLLGSGLSTVPSFLLIDLLTTPTVLIFVTLICSEVKLCKVNFATGQRFKYLYLSCSGPSFACPWELACWFLNK